MSELILVECPTCDGGKVQSAGRADTGEECPDCEGAGWLLVEGEPISLEDLERMAPWADHPLGRPLESGELEMATIVKPGSGGYTSTFTPVQLDELIRESWPVHNAESHVE